MHFYIEVDTLKIHFKTITVWLRQKPENFLSHNINTTLIFFNLVHYSILIILMHVFPQVIGSMCQSLAIKFGLAHAADMGSAFDAYLSAISAALLGSGCLLLCFILSEKSVKAVRSSLFVSFARSNVTIFISSPLSCKPISLTLTCIELFLITVSENMHTYRCD